MRILTFQLVNVPVKVRINGTNILFSNHHSGYNNFYPIDCLKFTKKGILKQFPDLKRLELGEMKEIAIQRLKDHINKLNKEEDITKYIINELEPHGYVLKIIERPGFRPEFR